MEGARSPVLVMMLALVGLLFPAIVSLPAAGGAGDASAQATDLATALAMRARRAPVAPAANTPAGDACAADELPVVASCTDDFLEPFQEFVTARRAAKPTVRNAPPGAASAAAGAPPPPANACTPMPALADAEVLIATLPDPVESGLKYHFDRGLDAVIRAIERSGFTRDRFWIPWGASAKEKDPANPCASFFPGVFIFRPPGARASGNVSSLVLFVVGETPTWGVQRGALMNALGFVAHQAERPKVRIVGPTFSGSAPSLRTALDKWGETAGSVWRSRTGAEAPKLTVRMISGSATDRANQTVFARDPAHPSNVDVLFSATTLPDDVLQDAFYTFLAQSWRVGGFACPDGSGDTCLDGVALLSESGTQYGQAAPRETRAAPRGRRDANAKATYRPELDLTFPLHIAAVRGRYDDFHRRQTDAPKSGIAGALEPIWLDPSLDTSDRRDTPPVLSLETAVSDDLVLTRLFAMLSQRRVRYLGIVATDPADTIFLAQQARAHLPDVRLFAFSNDNLFAHPALAGAFLGTVVVTPYPLVLESQMWTDPQGFERVEAFSTDIAEGTYNATLAQLWEAQLPAAAGGPDLPNLLDYRRPFALGDANARPLPDIWVSAIGGGGAWPIAKFTDYDNRGYAMDAPSRAPKRESAAGRPWNVRAPRTWQLVVFALFGVALYSALGFLLALRTKEGPLPFGFGPFVAMRVTGAWDFARQRHLFLALGSLLSAALVVGVTYVLPLWLGALHFAAWRGVWFAGDGWDAGIATAAALAVIAPLVVASVLAVRGLREGARPLARVSAGAILVAMPAVLFGAYACHWAGSLDELILFYVRATALQSRLSPIVPIFLLLALAYVYAFARLEQAHAIELLRGNTNQLAQLGLLDPWLKLEQALQGVSTNPVAMLAAVACVAVPAYCVFAIKPLDSIDGFRYSVAIRVGLLADLLLVAIALTWCVYSWTRMRALLRELARHPVVEVFPRLPAYFGGGLRSYFGAGLADLPLDLAGAAALARDAEAIAAKVRARICEEPAKVHALGDELRQLLAARVERPALPRAETNRRLVRALEAHWARQRAGAEKAADRESAAAAIDRWMEREEEVLARDVGSTILWALPHFRSVLALALGGALLVALTIASYSFQPTRMLATLGGVVVVSVLLLALTLFIAMDRDDVLSRLRNTTPGTLAWDRGFAGQVLMWVVLPFAGFLAVQYPEVASPLVSWAQPILTAAH